jgi:hypothetical protein
MRKILVTGIENERQILSMLRALRESVEHFPEALVIDIDLDDGTAKQLARLSHLGNVENLRGPYDLVLRFNLDMEDGIRYGRQDALEKIALMKRLTGQDGPSEIPEQAYGLVSSTSMFVEESLRTLVPNYSLNAKSNRMILSPYASYDTRYGRTIRRKLDSTIKAWEMDDKPVRDEPYMVIMLSDPILRKSYMDMAADKSYPNIINIYLDENYNVENCSEKLSLGEVLALVDNDACASVVSDNWTSWLGWAFDKTLVTYLGEPDEWTAIRSVKALSFNLSEHNFSDWSDQYVQTLNFHLWNFFRG